MKKGLLTTSALVAAGMFGLSGHANARSMKPNAIQLKVGGYMEQFIGAAFQRPGARNISISSSSGVNSAGVSSASGTVDQQTEAEIHFDGQTRLDNGLQVVAHVEYEVAGSPGNVIDQQYMILRNGFGQVLLGNDDPVASLMVTGYATPFVTSAGGSLTYDVTPWVPIGRAAGGPHNYGSPLVGALQDSKMENWLDDASEIVYVSPRINGLQVGVSYAPDSHQQLLSTLGQSSSTQKSDQLRTPPNYNGGGGPNTSVSDNWAFAANYTFAVDQVHVGVAGSYMRGNGTGNPQNGSSAKDPRAASAGVRIDYGPYRVNAGFKDVWGLENGNTLAGQTASGAIYTDLREGAVKGISNQGHMWMAGAMYTWGPNAVSAAWQRGTERGLIGASRSESLTIANVAYARHLAPGIKAAANLFYLNYSGQDTNANTPAGFGGAPGNVGWGMATSIRLDF